MNDLFDLPGARQETGNRQTDIELHVAEAQDKPVEGKQYSLCAIAKGKTWAEAEIK